jgi:SAM-dependent methyltransferase
VGVEVDPTAAAEARVAGLNVIEGSIEDVGLRESIGERFDVVIAADVLEHLANPDVVLKHFIRWLNPNGKAIVAVPNIATWSIRRQLFLHGDFSYQDSGILDRTHLHHFTWNTFHSLLREQNWRIEATMAGGLEMPILQRPLIGWPERIHAWLERGPAVEQGSLGGIQLGLRRAARGYVSLAASLSDEIGRLWPNLCVSHLALLLAPPKGGS